MARITVVRTWQIADSQSSGAEQAVANGVMLFVLIWLCFGVYKRLVVLAFLTTFFVDNVFRRLIYFKLCRVWFLGQLLDPALAREPHTVRQFDSCSPPRGVRPNFGSL